MNSDGVVNGEVVFHVVPPEVVTKVLVEGDQGRAQTRWAGIRVGCRHTGEYQDWQ